MTASASERLKTFAERFGRIYIRSFRECGAVVGQVADDIDNGVFGPKEWVKTVTALGDIAALSSIEIAWTILGGPGVSGPPKNISSDVCELKNPEACAHVLYLKQNLTLVGGSETIPPGCVSFAPGDTKDDAGSYPLVLPAGKNTFRVLVAPAGRAGGTYRGTVGAHPQTAGDDASKDQFVSVLVVL